MIKPARVMARATIVRIAAIVTIAAMAVLAPAAAAAADDTIVDARVDAQRIGEGDSLTLTIEVKGTNPGVIEDPDLSGLADFTIGGGPSSSTSTSMVWSGGQASSTTSKHFIYILLPRRRGTLTIPTISVRTGSRVRQTNPISVEVVEGRLLNRAPAPGRRSGPGIGPGVRRPAEPQGDVIVEAEVDRKEAFIGEQILLTYKVFTQVQLMEVPSPQRLPSHTGFWVEEIPVDPRVTIHRVQREGKEFIELTLMKKALFPTTSGDLEIEETVFSLPVKAVSQDPFDSIFFTPSSTLVRRTLPIKVKVKPLPAAGRPASFTGAVGSYSLSVQADRREAQVNDAVGLKVMVKGTGNIRIVGEPILPPLPDYKKFAPRAEEKKSLDQDRLSGSKTWDYVLSPLAPGHQDIPPIKFAWFDPARAAYVEAVSEVIPVVVSRGEGQSAIAGASPEATRREVTAFGRDIKYIKPASALAVRGRPFHRTLAYAGLMAAPVLLNGALFFMMRRKRHMEANADVLRGRRAPAFARRRLKEASRLLSGGKSREFHQEVSRALTGYLGDKLNTPPAGLTHQRIDELLAAAGVREALRGELQRCLEACDFARFAPTAPGPQEMQTLMDHAAAILARLEREIPADPLRRARSTA